MSKKDDEKDLNFEVDEAAEFAESADDFADVEVGDIEGEAALESSGAELVDFELQDESFSEDTELGAYESAEIEEVEEISEAEITAALESLLFATDKPMSVAQLKSAFQGTKVKAAQIRAGLERLQIEYASPWRGVSLEEVAGGYQIRTKVDFQKYLQRTVKARAFRLSGPALEVLSIVAYKQPCTKAMVDEIRGVESGHLMRGLLDRGLLHFAGKSELPGRPMFYETTRKFLEIFGLRNIDELPTLNEIDQLIPEGIGEVVEEKPKLADLTGELSTEVVAKSYSEGEEELLDISAELQTIETSSDFFEQEKRRQKEKRDAERAQDIRERLAVGEEVETKDQRWLARYEAELAARAAAEAGVTTAAVSSSDDVAADEVVAEDAVANHVVATPSEIEAQKGESVAATSVESTGGIAERNIAAASESAAAAAKSIFAADDNADTSAAAEAPPERVSFNEPTPEDIL